MLASGDMSALQPKIPLTQQSIDLPANEEGTIEGALEAETKRKELRSALREERRKKIKETNYLKSM
jgi:large subunit ribosomal protein L54